MPFFVSKETLSGLEDENQNLRERVEELERLKPSLDLALMLRDEMVRLMGPDGAPHMTPQEIGEIAYNNIRDKKLNEARDDLVARYEREHRKDIYGRFIEELEATEGESIAEEVRQKVEADPKLALELLESARKELGARAVGLVQTEVKDAQQKIVDKEAERLLELDRLDVQFAIERHIDLLDDAVMERLEVGDKLEIFSKDHNRKPTSVLLQWTKDANNHEGWVCVGATDTVADGGTNNGYSTYQPFKPNSNVFVSVGVVNRDLETTKEVV